MQLKLIALGIAVSAFVVSADAAQVNIDPNDSAIVRAKANLDRIGRLVTSGVLPRLRLDQAKDDLEDANDIAILHQTLYGKELSIDQADDMIAAAQRRVTRKQHQQEQMVKLVNQGLVSKSEISTYADETDRAMRELDWARNRAKLIVELNAMVRAEEDAEKLATLAASLRDSGKKPPVERFDGNGQFGPAIFARIQNAFQKRFGSTLPVSANGETAVHQSLGFDHRGRIDVAVNPDQPEGVWLRRYLTDNAIPFFAFRSAIAHQATGAHIHLGPPSTHCNPGACTLAD